MRQHVVDLPVLVHDPDAAHQLLRIVVAEQAAHLLLRQVVRQDALHVDHEHVQGQHLRSVEFEPQQPRAARGFGAQARVQLAPLPVHLQEGLVQGQQGVVGVVVDGGRLQDVAQPSRLDRVQDLLATDLVLRELRPDVDRHEGRLRVLGHVQQLLQPRHAAHLSRRAGESREVKSIIQI
jgi:hypothetical protein